MREAAEDLLSADPVLSEAGLRWPGVSLSRWQLAQGAVRPGCVVVEQVFGQYPAQVVLAGDQQPAGELAAQCADHRFADCVPCGRVRGAEENPDAGRGEDGVEGVGDLPGTIPDRELDTSALAEIHQEIALPVLFMNRRGAR
jgi:hypothetical protein